MVTKKWAIAGQHYADSFYSEIKFIVEDTAQIEKYIREYITDEYQSDERTIVELNIVATTNAFGNPHWTANLRWKYNGDEDSPIQEELEFWLSTVKVYSD